MTEVLVPEKRLRAPSNRPPSAQDPAGLGARPVIKGHLGRREVGRDSPPSLYHKPQTSE